MRHIKTWMKRATLLSVLALWPCASWAMTSQGGGDVGALAGIAFVNHNVGNHFTWGATAHYNLLPQINIGAYFQTMKNSPEVTPGISYDTRYNIIAAEGNYLFADMLEGAYLGVKVGLSFFSTSLPNTTTNTNFVLGGTTGYDFMLGNRFTAGPQVDVLWITSSPNLIFTNVLAVLKYSFF